MPLLFSHDNDSTKTRFVTGAFSFKPVPSDVSGAEVLEISCDLSRFRSQFLGLQCSFFHCAADLLPGWRRVHDDGERGDCVFYAWGCNPLYHKWR